VRTATLDLRQLDPNAPYDANASTVIRSSPLVVSYGRRPAVVFGWLPSDQNYTDGRISAVRLKYKRGSVRFKPLWTVARYDWKSSPALLPVTPGRGGRQGTRVRRPLVVTGYGLGAGTTGSYGVCDAHGDLVFGGILAIDSRGRVAWEQDFTSAEWIARAGRKEGNIRSSPAVADVDGDGRLEVLLTLGCYGELYAFDGGTGDVEWSFQLGPRTIGTPSLGDLDGDGALEIVAPSFDGQVWALGQ
jgi:hypothetical protein